jgi:hypothetical protein
VHFLGAPLATHVILEPPPGRGEGIVKRHEDVFVGVIEMVLTVDDDLSPGHTDIHVDRIEPPLAVVSVRLGDDNVAAGDPVAESLELVDVLERRVANGIVDRNVVEGDLGLSLHGGLLRRFVKT